MPLSSTRGPGGRRRSVRVAPVLLSLPIKDTSVGMDMSVESYWDVLPIELQEHILRLKSKAEVASLPSLTWDQVQFKKYMQNGNGTIRALHRLCGMKCTQSALDWNTTLHFDKILHFWKDTRGRACVSISLYVNEYGKTDHDDSHFQKWLKQFTDIKPELVERYYNKKTNTEKLGELYLHRNLIYIIRLPLR